VTEAAVPGAIEEADMLTGTLVGALITGTVTLLAVLVKYVLDVRSDNRRYVHELASQAAGHRHEIEVLRLRLDAERASALTEIRRRTAATYLADTHRIYLEMVDARRCRRAGHDDEEYHRRLRAISPAQCQLSLEEGRLVAVPRVVEKADALWAHLRGHVVPRGHDLTSAAWMQWKTEYWALRTAYISACRADRRTDPDPPLADVTERGREPPVPAAGS
jgi:hypothetical protein